MRRQSIRRGIVILTMFSLPITLYWFSPVLILQGAFQGIITGSFILFTLQFLLSLFFGRLWCSWICPVGGISVTCAMARPRPVKPGKKNFIRFFLWTPWVAAIVFGLLTSSGSIKIEPLYAMTNGISAGDIHGFIIYYIILILVVSMAFIGGQRAVCHTICWMSFFMTIGRKIGTALQFPMIHLKTNNESCIQCGLCSRKCSMGLPVKEMVSEGKMEHRECIYCGNCVDNCPNDVITYRFGQPHKIEVKKGSEKV